MTLNTVIFDMDGLLIDSEPCWEEAGKETLHEFGVTMSTPEYHTTTGLRTREWIDWWFDYYGINKKHAKYAETMIVSKAIDKIRDTGKSMPGVSYIFDFFKSKGFTIGLATSSPVELVKVVAEKLQIKNLLDGFSSAEELVYGKPHPEVYLNCAALLKALPLECVCFEDSVNGMVAAKAARMKCVVVPASFQKTDKRFGLADLQLSSLEDFSDASFDQLVS